METESDVRLQQARELGERLVDVFSPAGLIDVCSPFATLDDATRHLFRKAVHTAYLETSGIQARCEPLLIAVVGLDQALRFFRESCSDESSADAAQRCQAWEKVLSAAGELARLLDQLPKGVVFP